MPAQNPPIAVDPVASSSQQEDYSSGYNTDFRRLWHAIVERFWIVLLVTILCVLAGVAYIKRAQVLYAATATIQVEQDQQRIFKLENVQLEDLQALDYLQTIVQSLKARTLLDDLMTNSVLWSYLANPTNLPPALLTTEGVVAYFKDPTNAVALATNRMVLEYLANTNNLPPQLRSEEAIVSFIKDPTNAPLWLTTNFTLEAFLSTPPGRVIQDHIAAALDQITKVKLRRGTRLIDVTVTHANRALTPLIANLLVTTYVAGETLHHRNTGEGANEFLQVRSEELKKKLRTSEEALQNYKQTNNASSLDERQNTVVAKLKELNTKVTDAKSARIKAESDYNQALKLGTNIEALLTLTAVANDPAVVSLRLALSKAENDFAALKQRYKEKHPKYLQGESQLNELRSDVSKAVLRAPRGMKANLDAAMAAEEALAQALTSQETSALELNKMAIQYNVLARDVESDRALYEAVLNSMKETQVTKDRAPTRIRIQKAYEPEKPVSPKKPLILALSMLVGIFIGFVTIMSLMFLDTSIKTVDEAEAVLGLAVLSTVPQMKEVKKANSPLVVAEDAKSAGAEAFRTLRTSLSMLGRMEDRRVFLFTSAMPAEGKTFCSINYAASLAQLGLKTLLIDGDLRRPSVEKNLFGQDSDNPGVTDYLTGQKTLKEVARPTKVEGLSFICGGTTAPNPAELLARDGLAGLIADGLRNYDRVVIDSAPIHAVSDTLLMLKNVQTLCLVVRAALTPQRSVLRCVQQLRASNAPLSGVIMNRMPRRRSLGYGYYSHYYDYHYYGKYSKKGVYGQK